MIKKKIKFINQDIYIEKLENGFEIYILPNQNVKDAYITLNCNYGGVNYPFYKDGKLLTVPNGIAHFLEHKVFEQKSKIDPFTFFARTGTYCNAATNYFNTSYIIAGNQDYEKNLDYLLNFVMTPYFTDKNVLKEKGIIKEEIMMYEDNVDRVIYERILYNLFNKEGVKYSIGGTVEDINSITKENLYDVYNTFYIPSNMFIVITGNVDIKKTIDVIKKNKISSLNNKVIKLKKPIEKDNVYTKYETIKHNVTIPYIAYAFKIPINNLRMDKKIRNMYISSLFDILFDSTSLFYEKLKNNNIIDTPIYIESLNTSKHKVIIFMFKSLKYKEVISEIDKVLSNITIDKEDLERKKKMYISNLVYSVDNIRKLNNLIVNNKVLYNNLYCNMYDKIKKMNIDDLNNIITNMDLSNNSILVINNN